MYLPLLTLIVDSDDDNVVCGEILADEEGGRVLFNNPSTGLYEIGRVGCWVLAVVVFGVERDDGSVELN